MLCARVSNTLRNGSHSWITAAIAIGFGHKTPVPEIWPALINSADQVRDVYDGILLPHTLTLNLYSYLWLFYSILFT